MLVRFGDGDFRLSLGEFCARLRQLASRLRQPPLGLVQVCLKWPRVDLEEQLPLANEGTLGIFLVHKVAGNLGLDFRVDKTVYGADPLAVQGDVLLLDAGDQNLEWLGSGCGSRGVPA